MTDDRTHDSCRKCNMDQKLAGRGDEPYFRILGSEIYFYDSDFGWVGEKISYCPWCERCLREEGENG